MKHVRLHWKGLSALLLFNLILRLIFITYMHPPQEADFEWYFTHAVGIANGQGYVWGNQPTSYWPIGWPFALSLVIRVFGPHILAGLITNIVLSTAIVALVYLMTLHITKMQWPSFAAAIGYTLLPSHIIWNSVLGSEELFTFLLCGALYVYLRTTRFHVGDELEQDPLAISGSMPKSYGFVLLAGLLFGLAADVRPIGTLFPVGLFIYEWWLQRRTFVRSLLRTLTFTIGMFLAILPVTLRNWRVMHHFILVSTNGGTDLWQGIHINGGYYWTYNPYKNPLLKVSDEYQKNQIGQHVAFTYMQHHPLETLHMGLIKILDLYKDDVNSVWYTFHVVNDKLTVPVQNFATISYYIFMVIALVGIVYWLWTRTAWRVLILPVLWILYDTAIFLVFPAWDRFRYPMMPLYAIFFGMGTFVLYQAIRGRLKDPNIKM